MISRYTPAKLLARLKRAWRPRTVLAAMDMVESRYVGMKSRGVYETPGGTILIHTARRAMESITMDREVMQLRDSLSSRYSQMIYNGYWFSPERDRAPEPYRRGRPGALPARSGLSSIKVSVISGRP